MRAQIFVLFTFQILEQCFVGGGKAGREAWWAEKRNWKLERERTEEGKERREREEEGEKGSVASIPEYGGGNMALV